MEQKDIFYHQKSLILAKLFKQLYDKYGADNLLVIKIKEKYIEARRQISNGEDGLRYGHAEAYDLIK